MATDKLNVRFYGIRHPWGTTTRTDKVVAIDASTYYAGILEVAPLYRSSMGSLRTLPTAGINYLWGAASTSPQLLTKIEVLNPNAGAATFKLALMTTPTGSPDAGNAFLAWDTAIAGYGIFSWTGSVPLIDRYLYGQGSMSGLIFYFDITYIDPQ